MGRGGAGVKILGNKKVSSVEFVEGPLEYFLKIMVECRIADVIKQSLNVVLCLEVWTWEKESLVERCSVKLEILR